MGLLEEELEQFELSVREDDLSSLWRSTRPSGSSHSPWSCQTRWYQWSRRA
jgi:hypothetical protein